MNYELNLYINHSIKKAIFQAPLMTEAGITKIIHCHKYAEMHIVVNGQATILVENERYRCAAGHAFIIPPGFYHCYLEAEPDIQLLAFQTDLDADAFTIRDISPHMIAEIQAALFQESFLTDCAGLSSLLSCVAATFYPPVEMGQIRDDAVMIYEFISKNYNRDITIAELSRELCLSVKQTERLVKKHTGYTFKKAVMNCRIKIGAFLEKNTEMSRSEIANYVGYSNYSGYCKAKKMFLTKR